MKRNTEGNLRGVTKIRGDLCLQFNCAASQQRELTPPDTWSCPIWDLHLF